MKKIFLCLGLFIISIITLGLPYLTFVKVDREADEESLIITNVTVKESITISAIGDCTIGSDPNFGYINSFHQVYNKNTADYFFR